MYPLDFRGNLLRSYSEIIFENYVWSWRFNWSKGIVTRDRMIYNSLNTLAKCSVLRYDQDTYSVTLKLDTYLQIRGHHDLREINNILDNFIMYYSITAKRR